ncbi:MULTISPECIES: DUF6957 family protein [Shewanella]|uniref:DUF6957 family protein n=1 Tax=Shewanella TaxID=22 RepID=UPI001BC4FE47|nr:MULTISPECIES: hypothetical protein [Shewanella]MCL1136663.1 hypothetical protein [Shewanella hafniensis]MCS6175773.1 hypothetical protein [Shewanella baltica]GIU37638.1 hypothetical protein TUM4637_37360 [Shewanella hafniensis]
MIEKLAQQAEITAELFSLEGIPTAYGCRMDDIEQMKLHCKSIQPFKAWCVVSEWIIWIIDVPQGTPGTHPIKELVLANHIIEDGQGRFPSGGWVRTTMVIHTHHNCIFETNNTFYILVGSGNSKRLSLNEFGQKIKLFSQIY